MKPIKRKCSNCGSRSGDPDVVLYRFPKPGVKNTLRCELWAKFQFPNEPWSSTVFQHKLYSEHRMLCSKHFKEESFLDFASKKLHRHAAPEEPDCTVSPSPSSTTSIDATNARAHRSDVSAFEQVSIFFPDQSERPVAPSSTLIDVTNTRAHKSDDTIMEEEELENISDCSYNIKEEFWRDNFCGICLSFGRKLTRMGGLTSIYKKLLDSHEHANYKELLICWECTAVLDKIVSFQNKINKTNLLLMKPVQGSMVQPSLSTLNKTIILEESYKLISYEDSEGKTDTKDELINVKKPKNIWAQKRAVLNRRAKFKTVPLLMDEIPELYFRLRICLDEVRDWLVREKGNEFYKNTIFKCDNCVEGFENEDNYLKHIEMWHDQNKTEHKCNTCNVTLLTMEQLDLHKKDHGYKCLCKICGYVCYKEDHVRAHISRMHSHMYQCSLCGIKFWNIKDQLEHYKEMHETFICDYCGVTFKMKYCLRNHIRKKHQPVICEICNKVFVKYNSLWLHRKLKHSNGTQEKAYCVECDKHFDNIYTYKWHLNNSVKHKQKIKRSYPCGGCSKIFTKNTYMKEHYDLVHLKKNKFQCILCDKNFIRNADLMKHKRRVHDGVMSPRNKICYICGRGFTRNVILENHIRTHTGERPFNCEYCAAKFAQKVSLNTHVKLVHRNRTVP